MARAIAPRTKLIVFRLQRLARGSFADDRFDDERAARIRRPRPVKMPPTVTAGALVAIAPGSGAGNGPCAGDLPLFQVRFRDSSPTVQRMYREMEEGLLEAERRRAATKTWPAVATLAAEGIPPFAPARPLY